ncbi:helix-turn-helix domain-containing protein [Nocardia thailandica]|uniref:helix-turn-helix domain-containing protein n=1 Tax=Nocardia thailandica TaxID=257275 RepID=UPI001C3F278E|nr:helix-turn-helix transcriptional regulator [Nocardia thailandica]
MNPEEDKLTLSIVEALKNKGLSQSDIARAYGVTRQYVSWIKRTYGGSLTPRETVLKHFPLEGRCRLHTDLALPAAA